ncbi:hypothetical protein Tco_0837711 [Tanacetum coccineum]
METCEPVDTPMVEKSKLDEDPQGKAVDPTCYRGMIGTLMYLTSTLADADRIGCQDTRRSTSGSIQLLGDRLMRRSSDYQLADIFTKALGRERLAFLIKKLRMKSMSPETLKCLAEEEEE